MEFIWFLVILVVWILRKREMKKEQQMILTVSIILSLKMAVKWVSKVNADLQLVFHKPIEPYHRPFSDNIRWHIKQRPL